MKNFTDGTFDVCEQLNDGEMIVSGSFSARVIEDDSIFPRRFTFELSDNLGWFAIPVK